MPLLLTAAVAGLAATAAARRWPAHDPTAPKISATPAEVREAVRTHPRIRRVLRSRLDASTLTGLTLTAALVVVAGGVISMGLLLVMAQHDAGLARYDLSFARWGADNATSSSTRALKLISRLGGTVGIVTIALVVGIAEARRLRTRAVVAMLTLVVGGQFLVTFLIKQAVDRPRPDIHRLTGFSGTSFPSGHAVAAAATYAALALVLGRRRRRSVQTVLGGVAVAIAVAVAGTRVLLGVHWFTDVLAGLAVGWGWFALCSIAFGGRLLHFGAPAEQAERAAAAQTLPSGAAVKT